MYTRSRARRARRVGGINIRLDRVPLVTTTTGTAVTRRAFRFPCLCVVHALPGRFDGAEKKL